MFLISLPISKGLVFTEDKEGIFSNLGRFGAGSAKFGFRCKITVKNIAFFLMDHQLFLSFLLKWVSYKIYCFSLISEEC